MAGTEVGSPMGTVRRQAAAPAALSPLFVRIPSEQARRLDRASFELGRSKQALVSELVEQYLDTPAGRVPVQLSREHRPARPAGEPAQGSRRRRVTIEALEPEGALVGHHSFRPYERGPEEDVLSSEEAAGLLKVDVELVEQLAQDGELPGRRLGSEWRFARAALLAWLAGPAPAKPDGRGASRR